MSELLTDEATKALDRMDTVAACWEAISDLMVPGGEIQDRQKDHIATLTGFLADEYEKAREAFSQAVK